MNAITVTREFGAGGLEVARGLADALGWQLLDHELLHRAAALEQLPEAEFERLDEKPVGLIDRCRLHPAHEKYLHGLPQAARQAVLAGRVILVGRGTGQLVADLPGVFHLRLTAPRAWRVDRLVRLHSWSTDQALARCVEEDRGRDRFLRYFFGDAAFQPDAHDVVFDTARVPLDGIVARVAGLVRGEPIPSSAGGPKGTRVLTISRELGAAEARFVPTLAARLGLEVHGRDLLDQEVLRLGVAREDLERLDEHPAGIFERWYPGSLHHRYVEASRALLNDLADRGDVLIVGRGGCGFLRDHPGALHVRLVAPLSLRIRQVMEHYWVRAAGARRRIDQSDTSRAAFHRGCFGTDWADPLGYHLTVNLGRLGARGLDLVVAMMGGEGRG